VGGVTLDLEVLLDELADRIVARLEAREAELPAGEAWRLLPLTEVAQRLGRSERWVRERVKVGELPRVRLDAGALAFLTADVVAFAEARRVGGNGAMP
jgi:predicted DNA-binding transcriptional regulator AlpA